VVLSGSREADFEIGPRALRVVEADITRLSERVGAVVSSDDNYLSHGGGVAAAIWAAAGAEWRGLVGAELPRLTAADVYASPAGDLAADLILHAVTIDYDLGRRLEPSEATDLYGRVLDAAGLFQCQTLATPLLAAGGARFGSVAEAAETAASALASALWERADEATSVAKIILTDPKRTFSASCKAIEGQQRQWQSPRDLLAQAARTLPTDQQVRLYEGWRIASAPLRDPSPGAEIYLLEACLQAMLQRSVELAKARFTEDGRQPPTAAPFRIDPGSQPPRIVLQGEIDDMPLGRAVAACERLLAYARRPLHPYLIADVRDAVGARNRYAHAATSDGGSTLRARRALMRGIRAIAGWLVETGSPRSDEAAASQLASLPALATASAATGSVLSAGWLVAPQALITELIRGHGRRKLDASTIVLGAELAGRSEPDGRSRRTTGTPPPAGAGTEHVRNLHRFLSEALDPATKQEILAELAHQGYRGEEDTCLLEYCVRVRDPVSVLADHFTVRQLRAHVLKMGGPRLPATTDARKVATELMRLFGFPVAARPQGLTQVLQHLQRYQREAEQASDTDLRGLVTEGGRWLEYALHVLLRFVCMAAFGLPPERYLRDKGWLEEHRRFDRSSLGSLLNMLEDVANDFRENWEARSREFGRDFEIHRLAPKGTGAVAALRNQLAHYRTTEQAADWAGERVAASKFFEEAIGFLEYLRDPEHRVFPQVLLVEEIRYDNWGRRVVTASNEDGEPEYVFTDRELVPAQTYYMHSLSNPLRVDPLLVPAGDLAPPTGNA
jgi:O-acetyl-ADP-ribose deacetylase (regulator of RNase III)